jgi:hypothetical protein
LTAIVTRGGAVTDCLRSIILGGSDTGFGGSVSSQAVISLVQACPNLVVCSLDATTRVEDNALVAACQSCPALEYLRITGNDKVKGSIRGTALQFLADNLTVAPNLKALVLLDQNDSQKAFKAAKKNLSNARKGLEIHTGETLGDGIADNMVAMMTGGAVTEVMVGGKVVSFDHDFGIGPYIGDFEGYDTFNDFF